MMALAALGEERDAFRHPALALHVDLHHTSLTTPSFSSHNCILHPWVVSSSLVSDGYEISNVAESTSDGTTRIFHDVDASSQAHSTILNPSLLESLQIFDKPQVIRKRQARHPPCGSCLPPRRVSDSAVTITQITLRL